MTSTNISETLVLGAVAYDPKTVTIWEGFKAYFTRQGLPFDFILYSNYERLVEDLISGHIHAAWNSPLAYVRAARMARAVGKTVEVLALRDSDCDLHSVIIVKADSPIKTAADLKGRVIAVGAIDSPQATLIPLEYLRTQGLQAGKDFTVQRHDLLGGKHGDHIGGEREGAKAVVQGKADAACIIESNYAGFIADGTLPKGAARILTLTMPYDHCNLTAGPFAPKDLIARFKSIVMNMSYEDPAIKPLFDLEGLKEWRQPRVEGYRTLDTAVEDFGFYKAEGAITAVDYHF